MFELTVKAYAKVNLFLYIVGRNNKGYHLLQSLFTKLTLADVVKISTIPDKDISCAISFSNEFLGSKNITISNNIAVIAAEKLRDYLHYHNHKCLDDITGVMISIHKSIPIAAGLAGGSSNAAAVLNLLNKLWKANLPQSILFELAYSIGADVAFCLQEDKVCFVEGIGECLTPVKLDECFYILLVNPSFAVDTGKVFSQFVIHNSNQVLKNKISKSKKLTAQLLKEHILTGYNDLYTAAVSLFPELLNVIALLKRQDGCIAVNMSGSGATCFAIFNDLKKIESAAKSIKAEKVNWWVYWEELKI